MSRCEATTDPCYWWDDRKITFPRCRRSASVEIDGVKMCVQHAGTFSILKLIHMGEATKLESAAKNGPLCSLHGDKWAKRIGK